MRSPRHAARVSCGTSCFSYIAIDEIPGFFLLLENNIFIARNEDSIVFYLLHVKLLVSPWFLR